MANNHDTMNLQSYVSSQRGRAAQLAKALHVKQPTVSDWVNGKKAVPLGQCMPIERATGGAVTRRDLMPDDYLDHWPELAEAQPLLAPAATENVAESGV